MLFRMDRAIMILFQVVTIGSLAKNQDNLYNSNSMVDYPELLFYGGSGGKQLPKTT